MLFTSLGEIIRGNAVLLYLTKIGYNFVNNNNSSQSCTNCKKCQ